MGHLGEVLEILFGPSDRVLTVRATIRHWRDCDVEEKANATNRAAYGRMKETPVGERRPRTVESTLSLWLRLPGCARVEKQRVIRGAIEIARKITDGERLWECDAEGHVDVSEYNQKKHGCIGTEIDRHFASTQIRQLLEQLALSPVGLTQVAGRDCVQVRAAVRPDASIWLHWLPTAADEYELHFDLKNAALLNIISRFRGEVLERYEVVEVGFDEPMGDDIFTYEPAPGEQVGPKTPTIERMSLATAVARMAFTVLVPAGVMDSGSTRLDVSYYPTSRHGGWPHLGLVYYDNKGFERTSVSEGSVSDPQQEHYEWEPIEDSSSLQKGLRISDPGGSGVRIVAFEQLGTHVTISSKRNRERLIELAKSFVPVQGTTHI